MTSRQVTISQIHHRKHLNNEPLDEDPCCPAYYSVQQTPPSQFIELWNWLSITLCPPLARFNQNTVDAFEAAELLQQQLTRNNVVTAENRTVLVAYQRIFETALYRRSPDYVPSELSSITSGQIPTIAPREIEPLLRTIQTAWVTHVAVRRRDS